MIMFKGCHRCHGDLYKDRDIYGEFVLCLQCGYYLSDSEVAELASRFRSPETGERRRTEEPALAA